MLFTYSLDTWMFLSIDFVCVANSFYDYDYDYDISMDIHVKSVDMDMDMDVKFHIHGNPGFITCSAVAQYCVKARMQS